MDINTYCMDQRGKRLYRGILTTPEIQQSLALRDNQIPQDRIIVLRMTVIVIRSKDLFLEI
jgi:hypothetical protein